MSEIKGEQTTGTAGKKPSTELVDCGVVLDLFFGTMAKAQEHVYMTV